MIDVLFVLLPDSLLLDLAGPAETFRLANQHLARRGMPDAFRLRYAGPLTHTRSSVGLGLGPLEPLPATLGACTWVVLLGRPGEARQVVRHERPWLQTRDWLARVLGPVLDGPGAGSPHALITVCVGALLAADAGLVGHRRITTHHELIDDLRAQAPQAAIVENRVFVEDGPLCSSAGITAGIDLALHKVAQVCGDAVAQAVARVMVAYSRRGPQDPEQSPLLAFRDHLHPAVHRVQDALTQDPKADWTAARMAEVAHVTPRHLGRLFQAALGISPRDYLEQLRCALARQALARGATPQQAIAVAGFRSERQLREAMSRAG